MRRNMGIANEKGLTLVEILAALVILGIVFVGFMTIFPQMTSFNEKTETKLVAMNLAKKRLNTIKQSDIPEQCKNEKERCLREIKDPEEEEYKILVTYKKVEVDGFDANVEGQANLYQVYIQYFKPKEAKQPISETFGYVPDKYNKAGGK